jgi:ferredoxin
MAAFPHRHPGNARGAFYVDDSCLDCDLCRGIAPNNFARDSEHGCSFVSKQPQTPEELVLCREAVQGCPCESIGADGDGYDWVAIPAAGLAQSSRTASQACHCRPNPNHHDPDTT